MRILRTIAAIPAAVFAFFLIVGACDEMVFRLWPGAVTPDHQHTTGLGPLAVMGAYWLAGVAAAGAVAALVAGRNRRAHAAAAGMLLLVYFAANAVNSIGTVDPVWWHVILAAAAVPTALAGANFLDNHART